MTLADMVTKNKAGKSILSVPKGGIVNMPARVTDEKHEFVAAFSNEGRLLIFPVTDLPKLSRGKGVKIMNVPKDRVLERLEFMHQLRVVSEVDTMVIASGKRTLNLNINELEHYLGKRAKRGLKLPRGFQKVDSVTVMRGGS